LAQQNKQYEIADKIRVLLEQYFPTCKVMDTENISILIPSKETVKKANKGVKT
jgi:hypothetical protein